MYLTVGSSSRAVYGRLSVVIVGSNPARGKNILSVLSIVCYQVEVSATGRSLVQSSTTECGASLCVM
jgi:hypothetical protein